MLGPAGTSGLGGTALSRLAQGSHGPAAKLRTRGHALGTMALTPSLTPPQKQSLPAPIHPFPPSRPQWAQPLIPTPACFFLCMPVHAHACAHCWTVLETPHPGPRAHARLTQAPSTLLPVGCPGLAGGREVPTFSRGLGTRSSSTSVGLAWRQVGGEKEQQVNRVAATVGSSRTYLPPHPAPNLVATAMLAGVSQHPGAAPCSSALCPSSQGLSPPTLPGRVRHRFHRH